MSMGANQLGIFAAPTVVTSPQPNGPGGNTIVPTPASPGEWPKMLLAIGVLAGGIWMVDSLFGEDAAKWTSVIVLGAMVTYYETHGNKHFSQGLSDLTGVLKW